jgi:hypothetical protein
MASATAASHLVEIADPPVPSCASPIRDKSMGEKLKTLVLSLCIGVALSAVSWLMLHDGYTLYGIVAGAIGLFAVIAGFSGSTLKAACPYCGASIDAILNREEGRQERCATCSEYSTVNAGLLRPLDPATTSEPPKFESPVFRNGVWPKGCVVCGEPPVRFDDLSKTTLGAVPALMGHLQIVRGSIRGIPYCDKHRDKMSLKVGSDKKLFLCWGSLRMMRRYLAANRNRQVY